MMNAHKDFCKDPICPDCEPVAYKAYVDHRTQALQHWSDVDLKEEYERRRTANVEVKLANLKTKKANIQKQVDEIDDEIIRLEMQQINVHH